MTDLFVVLLMLIIGVVFSALTFWLKRFIFGILSGLCWAIVGVYCLVAYYGGGAGVTIYTWGFAFFCLAASLFMFISPLMIRDKNIEEDKEIDEYDEFEKEQEDYDKELSKHRRLRRR